MSPGGMSARQTAILVASVALTSSLAAALAVVASGTDLLWSRAEKLGEECIFASVVRSVDNNAAQVLYSRSALYDELTEGE